MSAIIQAQAAATGVITSLARPAISADVEFGTLDHDGDCVGIGICRLQPMVRTKPGARQRCQHATARLSVGEAGRLQLFFPLDGMRPCTERAFFRGWLFPVPVACVVPDSLTAGLSGLRQTIILPGAYPIRRSPAGYTLEF